MKKPLPKHSKKRKHQALPSSSQSNTAAPVLYSALTLPPNHSPVSPSADNQALDDVLNFIASENNSLFLSEAIN